MTINWRLIGWSCRTQSTALAHKQTIWFYLSFLNNFAAVWKINKVKEKSTGNPWTLHHSANIVSSLSYCPILLSPIVSSISSQSDQGHYSGLWSETRILSEFLRPLRINALWFWLPGHYSFSRSAGLSFFILSPLGQLEITLDTSSYLSVPQSKSVN